ncbi:class I adenylate-forming enzyme family protein [Nocardioides sp. NPDC057767]|uniref:class I adenylate-forming enzyme family protein n=1 Tax=unclassified Nocardioides TaxID=2615069 RepID=UPI0036729C6D
MSPATRPATGGYWPAQLPRELSYAPITVGDLNAGAAAAYGDRVALRDGEETLTFAELHARACAIAHGLRAAGVGDRDVVVLHQPNSLWFLPSYYGILLAGATVSPTNPLQPVPGLRAQIEQTRAVAALSHPEHARVLDEARAGTGLRTVVVVPPTSAAPTTRDLPADAVRLDDFVAGHPTTPPETRVGPDDVAHLAYTGGTTGVSKAVRVLHRNVVANVAQMTGWRAGHAIEALDGGGCMLVPLPDAAEAGVAPGDAVSIVVSPMFHAHALINSSFLHVCGTTQVLLGRFEPTRMLDLAERERATYITGSPTMWHALVGASADTGERDFSSVRVVSSGAAPIDGPTLEALQDLFPSATILEGYGLTEATCLVSGGIAFRDGLRKQGSVGLPVFDTELQIRSGVPGEPPLGPGQRGELWVRGPQVTDGYLGRPDATAAQYVEGWLDTGDIGYIDEDGFLFICDRAKDMLIYKGYNVYPRELEDLLVSHPDVGRAAVVGRDVTGFGQEPVAFVVPAADRRVDATALMTYVAERVLPYKKIRAVHVVDQLPSNPAGKILKNELRAIANEPVADEPLADEPGDTHA